MTLWIHSAILAATVSAIAAVGIAGASFDASAPVAAKADRLPLASAADETYLTVETRRDGVSVLNRIPVDTIN
jgi:hypothetical protein